MTSGILDEARLKCLKMHVKVADAKYARLVEDAAQVEEGLLVYITWLETLFRTERD